MKARQRGFSLVTAIFLLTVVAGLVVYMVNLRGAQTATLLFGVQGARALQAARSGIEWGIYRALNNPGCFADETFQISGQAFAGFDIEVRCAQTAHMEGTSTINVYRIESIARSGSYGELDYVQRRLEATVSIDPP